MWSRRRRSSSRRAIPLAAVDGAARGGDRRVISAIRPPRPTYHAPGDRSGQAGRRPARPGRGPVHRRPLGGRPHRVGGADRPGVGAPGRHGPQRRCSTTPELTAAQTIASGSTSTPCGGSRCPMSGSTRAGWRKPHCSSAACRGCGSSGRPSTGASGRSSTPRRSSILPARLVSESPDEIVIYVDAAGLGPVRAWYMPYWSADSDSTGDEGACVMSSDDGLLEVVGHGTRAGPPAPRVLARSAAHCGVRRRLQLRRLRTAA